MTKAFSILHRAAALLVALCLLVGMALPVYAAEDGALFFDAGSETIPTIPAANTSSEGVEPAQEPIVSDLETIPDEGDTPPTANEPGTEVGDTANNTAAVPNNDGKTQEAAENQTPAADTDTAPADPALTNKTPADTSDTAAAPNHAINAEETTAAKNNTEQDVLFADGDNPNEEDTMLADDLPDNDDANTPDTIADTSVSTGFIPATATIYFEDDGRYDSKLGGKCTLHFHACTDSKTNAYIDKVMADTGETVTDQDGKQHKIFSVTLNSADYPAGGFYRIIFQYMEGNSWKEEINAFGNDNVSNTDKLTAIDLLAGKKLVSVGITNNDQQSTHFNQNQPYNPAQWTRVEYYYKDTPLYFKNASDTALTNVTATFYKLENGAPAPTDSQTIGTVDADKLAAQQIRIPDNQSRFVQLTWNNGQSALYDFTTDFTAAPYVDAKKLDLTTANCYACNGTDGTWESAGGDLLTADKKIYFDATLSAYSYEGEGLQQSAMGDGETMYCFLTSSDGAVTPLSMTQEKPDSTAADRKLWSCEIPNDGKTYTAVQFSATDNQNAPAKYNKTKKYSTAEIPPTLQEPCFFADDGDPSAYTNGDVYRDGYWGEKASVRDAESGKNTTVVDIASDKFTQEPGTKYITSTLYDYYTDYELNGLNRDTYSWVTTSSQRGYVTFEQFNRALSSAYTANGNVKYPLYTGHFQPSIWDNRFAYVAEGMGLYGWGAEGSSNYNTFMAVNNSALDDNGNGSNGNNDYSRTFQGLVESKTSDDTADGLPLLRTKNSETKALADPHFNKDFLQGKNAFNTVLGKVYENVSFPLKQKPVFATNPENPDPKEPEGKAQYWYYDSSKSSLYLKQNQTDGKYYLESPKGGDGNPTTDSKSQNISSPNSTNGTNGFFPFNQTVSTVGASQYNYGFGAKLQFDFTLTKDGNVVVGKDNDGNDIKVPIKFFFSGDDDVWVYIDGELMLDVGGAHGKASGLLEFGPNNTVTPYVSSNKNTDQNDTMVYKGYGSGETTKTVKYNGQPITFNKKGTTKPLKDQSTHTLTMYYMERGMWESNMALAFNFPDNNELQVEKQVDLSNVNTKFKSLFQNQKLFTFALQNLATHYGTKPITNTTPDPVAVGSNFTASSSDTDRTTMEKGVTPSNSDSEDDKAKTVKWYAQGYDKNSKYRSLRYGAMTLDSPLNISETHDYLSFDVYAVGNTGDGVLSTNYLYLTLVDNSGNQMGCDANSQKSYLNTMLSGSVVMKNNQWVTVKLQLDKMPKDTSFDLSAIKKILIGDDYERTVYFRNFVFTAKPVANTTVGFSVEQADIPDYGSAESNTLKPASGAIFTSSVAGSGTQAVDTDGTFDLQDGETVTFTDQFRRGSYISLQEAENTALYDTRWEVYENGTLVSAAGTSSSVNAASPLPLQGDSTKPEDNRTETADSTTGSSYNGSKPTGTNTLVFRSYAAPEEEFPKLKVKFINTVKVGTLVIKKEQPNDETTALTGSYTFTVTFSNVGGIGLSGADGEKMTKDLAVGESWTITGIPVGTRFRVVETPPTDGSLKSVTCDATDAKYDVDNGVRGTVTGEAQVTATFTNTAHQLMDIEVEKQWQDANGNPLTDNQSATVWVKLQRRHAGTSGKWVDATDAVELQSDYMTGKWTHTFERLDKTDVNDSSNPDYEYRVAECASKSGEYKAEGTVTIGTYTYTASQTTDTTGKITLINKRTDPKFALNLTKKGIDGTAETLLDGVAFKLEKLNDVGTAETTYNGVTGSDSTNQGKCSFTSLTPGSYRLTETKTAEGYTLLAEPIEFTLTAAGQCLRDGAAFGAKTTDADGVCNIALTIYNRKGFTLPHTGADAPSLWLLIGLPALVAVLLVLVFRYNKKGGKHS